MFLPCRGGHFLRISSKSALCIFSYVGNRQTNPGKNITSLVDVIKSTFLIKAFKSGDDAQKMYVRMLASRKDFQLVVSTILQVCESSHFQIQSQVRPLLILFLEISLKNSISHIQLYWELLSNSVASKTLSSKYTAWCRTVAEAEVCGWS